MRCVALLSGGLDSQVAIRLMQQQGIEVEAFNFKTVFTCCRDQSARVARRLDVPLTILDHGEDYFEVIRNPQFGYGRGANPCIDCRIHMFRRALQFMKQVDARFVVSGEVVGQRVMSQKRRDLETIAHHSDEYDRILRPLSAHKLPPTLPERRGWVDRSKLHGFWGKGRRDIIQLARSLGLDEIPDPSTGCALTEEHFSQKVFDLLELDPVSGAWDFRLLKYGRHFRFDARAKVVVGRRETENVRLEYMHGLPAARSSALLRPADFRGPAALVVGPATEDVLAFARGLIERYAKRVAGDGSRILLDTADGQESVISEPHPTAEQADTIAAAPYHRGSSR